MADENDKLKAIVLRILADDAISELDFSFDGISVTPDLYGEVEDAVSDGKISVIVSPNLLPGKVNGRYFNKLPLPDADKTTLFDLLVFRSAAEGTAGERISLYPTIVHECTHAGFDVLKRKNMTVLQSEAAAYIAQDIFFRSLSASAKMKLPEPTTPIGKALLAISELKSKKAIGKKLMNALYTAILGIEEYKGVDKVKLKTDGVGRAPEKGAAAARH